MFLYENPFTVAGHIVGQIILTAQFKDTDSRNDP